MAMPMGAEAYLPGGDQSVPSLRSASARCQACDLYKAATQTVFGEGNHLAKALVTDEQPGDQEDVMGTPFVGPAGRVLDDALDEAGLDRADLYITNAVKHFKWEARGKRRLHKRPSAREVSACRPWLLAEIDAVGPQVVVALDACASQPLLGAPFRVARQRGHVVWGPGGIAVIATVHPSAILRLRDRTAKDMEFKRFVADLSGVSALPD
jgi:DNA polymerase